jgi:hypothetical protein
MAAGLALRLRTLLAAQRLSSSARERVPSNRASPPSARPPSNTPSPSPVTAKSHRLPLDSPPMSGPSAAKQHLSRPVARHTRALLPPQKLRRMHTDIPGQGGRGGPPWGGCRLNFHSSRPARSGRTTTIGANHHEASQDQAMAHRLRPGPFIRTRGPAFADLSGRDAYATAGPQGSRCAAGRLGPPCARALNRPHRSGPSHPRSESHESEQTDPTGRRGRARDRLCLCGILSPGAEDDRPDPRRGRDLLQLLRLRRGRFPLPARDAGGSGRVPGRAEFAGGRGPIGLNRPDRSDSQPRS